MGALNLCFEFDDEHVYVRQWPAGGWCSARRGGRVRTAAPLPTGAGRSSGGCLVSRDCSRGKLTKCDHSQNIDHNLGTSKDCRFSSWLIMSIIRAVSLKIFCNVGPSVVLRECREHLPLWRHRPVHRQQQGAHQEDVRRVAGTQNQDHCQGGQDLQTGATAVWPYMIKHATDEHLPILAGSEEMYLREHTRNFLSLWMMLKIVPETTEQWIVEIKDSPIILDQ